jgi:oxygen-dependent protoporphyrinogen oxidase
VTPALDQTWIAGLPRGGAAPLPADTVLGIPANPWAEGVRPFIGMSGAWRAYLDRLRPPLTIGKEHNLARLVGKRMGPLVLERMVAPLTSGSFGVTPEQVDVIVAAPGLGTALTRTGSLGGAVAELLVDRQGVPSIESLEGGMPRLVDALLARLGQLGVRLVADAAATGLVRGGDGWRVELGGRVPSDPELAPADLVIVATDPGAAAGLLGPHTSAALKTVTDAAPLREIVTLVVDAPALDGAPRGTSVYPVAGAGLASGVVHQTARWEWLAREAGPHVHVLSVAFDGPRDGHPTTGLSDADLVAAARDAASALLGVPIDGHATRGTHRAAYTLAWPASVLGHAYETEAARAAVDAVPGLAAVGAWLAGSGLAQVVADAVQEADRLRRQLLWGADTVR